MKFKRMVYLCMIAVIALVSVFAWNLVARAAYESAEYKVMESDGKFEVREYPDLMLVSTRTQLDAQGRDGSFMKLFRYIGGANEAKLRVWMETKGLVADDSAKGSVETAGYDPPFTPSPLRRNEVLIRLR